MAGFLKKLFKKDQDKPPTAQQPIVESDSIDTVVESFKEKPEVLANDSNYLVYNEPIPKLSQQCV
ncbi:MAG: hypothetical protein KKF89_02570 [Nanoarchaeota archaeon]|nr:hypothetical protein [Nanoarchaeota archaeon]